MNKMLVAAALTAIGLSGLTSCDNSAESKDAQLTAERQQEANRQVGLPNIVNWQEKRLVKQIYEVRDQEKLMTYTCLTSRDGIPVILTRSVGYGIPYGTQFTNPQKSYGAQYSLPQSEPNGLFMPNTAEST